MGEAERRSTNDKRRSISGGHLFGLHRQFWIRRLCSAWMVTVAIVSLSIAPPVPSQGCPITLASAREGMRGEIAPPLMLAASDQAHVQASCSAAVITDLTNKIRAEHGLHPLRPANVLAGVAEARLRDMFERQYFGHVSPTGEGPSDLARQRGYDHTYLAENIARATHADCEKLLDNWMHSKDHRGNILSNEAEEIGVALTSGTLNGSKTMLAVQVFGKPGHASSGHVRPSSCTTPSPALREQIDKDRREITVLSETAAEIKRELDGAEPGSVSQAKLERYNALASQVITKNRKLQEAMGKYNAAVKAYNDCVATK
jgi:uncharacterized protein YkwD